MICPVQLGNEKIQQPCDDLQSLGSIQLHQIRFHLFQTVRIHQLPESLSHLTGHFVGSSLLPSNRSLPRQKPPMFITHYFTHCSYFLLVINFHSPNFSTSHILNFPTSHPLNFSSSQPLTFPHSQLPTFSTSHILNFSYSLLLTLSSSPPNSPPNSSISTTHSLTLIYLSYS